MTNNIIEKLKQKMDKYNAIILDIQKDKDGNDTYILMKDQRYLKINYNNNRYEIIRKYHPDFKLELENGERILFPNYNGYIDLFIINKNTIDCDNGCLNYHRFPFMCAKFYDNYVEIVDIIVTLDNNLRRDFARKGYGSMMINCLEKICKQYNIPEIRGNLVTVDATSEEAKNRRNEFYRSNGFELFFKDENCIEGTINKKIDISDNFRPSLYTGYVLD